MKDGGGRRDPTRCLSRALPDTCGSIFGPSGTAGSVRPDKANLGDPQADREHPDPDVPPTAPSNSFAPAATQPEHPGSLGVAIMCGVALEEGWSVGCVRPVRGVLRDRSVRIDYRSPRRQPPGPIRARSGRATTAETFSQVLDSMKEVVLGRVPVAPTAVHIVGDTQETPFERGAGRVSGLDLGPPTITQCRDVCRVRRGRIGMVDGTDCHTMGSSRTRNTLKVERVPERHPQMSGTHRPPRLSVPSDHWTTTPYANRFAERR